MWERHVRHDATTARSNSSTLCVYINCISIEIYHWSTLSAHRKNAMSLLTCLQLHSSIKETCLVLDHCQHRAWSLRMSALLFTQHFIACLFIEQFKHLHLCSDVFLDKEDVVSAGQFLEVWTGPATSEAHATPRCSYNCVPTWLAAVLPFLLHAKSSESLFLFFWVRSLSYACNVCWVRRGGGKSGHVLTGHVLCFHETLKVIFSVQLFLS